MKKTVVVQEGVKDGKPFVEIKTILKAKKGAKP